MKQLLGLLTVTLLFLSFFTASIDAATKKPAAKSSDITVSASVKKNKTAVIATFGNLHNAKSVSFTLIYSTNGRQEGAGGSIKPKKGQKTVSRELLLGTCSKNVCRYHKNLKNMKLEVITTLTSGKQSTKKIPIKI